MPEGCNSFTYLWGPGAGPIVLPNEAGLIWGSDNTIAVTF